MPDAPELTRPPRRPSIKAVTIGIMLGLFSTFAYAWFLIPPDVVAEPVHLSRDADGTLVHDGNDAREDGTKLKAHFGALNARNNTVMSSSESHANPAFLAASRLAIYNESDHLLIARVATALLEQWKQDSPFSAIDYFPGTRPADIGRRAPDLYLTLNLQTLDESGLLGRDLHAVVAASFGSSFASSNYGWTDNQSPPTVAMQSSIEVDHTSSLTGVESSAARYEQQGQDIAKQISKHILDKLKKLREKHDPLPELPTALYPEWSPEPDFAFLDRLHARRLIGVHGLMLRNESLWEYQPTGDPISIVTSIRDELLATDWKEHNFYTDHPEHFSLHMSKGDAMLTVFPERRNCGTQHQQGIRRDDALAGQPASPRHYVQFRDRLSRPEIQSVVDDLFAASPPDITLLMTMQSNWQGDQHSRAIRLIEEHGVRSAEAWLLVAASYSRRKDLEGTRRALACCQLLARTMTSSSDLDQRIRKIAKEHSMDEKQFNIPETELLKMLGVAALNPEVSPRASILVRFGEPAAFSIIDDDGNATIFTYTIDKLPGANRFRILALKATGGHRSWSTQEASGLNYLRSFEHDGLDIEGQLEQTGPDTLTVRVSARTSATTD